MRRFVPVGVTYKAGEKYPNYRKFRYSGEKCIGQTRVVLKNRGKGCDFINANWVGSPAPGATKYICTQAPLKETQEDFWHMCFTEKASLILMLCDFTEGYFTLSRKTSSHYFPEKQNETLNFGAYTVTMKDKLNGPEIEKTDFTVLEIKCIASCDIGWTFALPSRPNPFSSCGVVVLCATGEGRVPTFAGIELTAHRITSKPEIDMMDVVKELRKQRFAAISSTFQFLYLHYLVLDYFVQEKLLVPHHQSLFVEEYRRIVTDRLQRVSVH
ncbi:hypothetical protein PRIPAC_75920 [Pristionchus pacificus]|uniref:Tyrosine phosphatase n=1 Tax=Pristionchus pacificus TaxID=54126 RepID=A0A2A6CGQ4_PRIPA|nr:hypothetical protein PRIPAC_75920 [Pristionchus pacificus]|eukprot:PDM77276.1 tyrosine phosphatase [Pristionchus pacificus]